ncbi:MAG: hypothetical protein AB1696_19455 [Planctomycetota bacterium]
MAEHRTEYVIRLGPDDRYRHLHNRVRRSIVSFRVQYETRIKDKWLPVVRYDTAHGYAHRDLLDPDGHATKTPLFNQDPNEALLFAENDLKANWIKY